MKINFTKLLVTGAVFFAAASCSKNDDNNNNTAPNAINSTQLFNYSDAWGLLAGVKTVTYQTIP
ncbi:MAG TPA: hypothetical protein VK154_12195, partial [Chitinophagales bacterium]|nr:hypothetical protein [Chitinophagales bacterium]